jgi:hypothetical protein
METWISETCRSEKQYKKINKEKLHKTVFYKIVLFQ